MPLWDTVGDIAVVEIERISPLLGKMLGAALGGSVGIGSYRYFQPARLGKGFDRGKGSARDAGIAGGRAIAGGNLERVHQTRGIAKTPEGAYRFSQKHLPVQQRHRHRKRVHSATCTCCQARYHR